MDQYNALLNMQKKGSISVLFIPTPFHIIAGRAGKLSRIKSRMESSSTSCPVPGRRPGDVRRVKIEGPEFKRAYERYALRTYGAVLRDEPAWNEY